MVETIRRYLGKQGLRYRKPEKAGPLAAEMAALKDLGQAARQEFTKLAQLLALKLPAFEMGRVSNWASQAQIARPHFWCYFKQPEDEADAVALAIRVYGSQEDFGISVEVSFIERKKSDQTLARQHRVLDLPIAAPLYYLAQEDGVSRRLDGTEANRKLLQEAVAAGQVRKVLVKYDVPVTAGQPPEELADKLASGFEKLLPYYEASHTLRHSKSDVVNAFR